MDREAKTQKYRDLFLLCITAGINVFLFWQAILIFKKKQKLDSPGTFPLILTSLMLLLTLIVIIQTIRNAKQNKVEKYDSIGLVIVESIKEEIPLNVFVSFLGSILYYVLFKYTGFIISTLVFLIGLMMFLDRKRWKTILITSVIIVAAVYVVFGLLFHVRLS